MPLFEVHDWPSSNELLKVAAWGKNGLQTKFDDRSAQQMTALLLEALLSKPYFKLKLENTLLSEPELIRFKHQLNRIYDGEALQYITSKAHFFDLELFVAPGVLIPRPETEELVVLAESLLPKKARLIDLGTGSGCIALALKHRNPGMEVLAADVSPEALSIAQKNKKELSLDLELFQFDILSEGKLPGKFNAIVSNPPYIPELEKSEMPLHVTNQEPALALFVPNEDPLLFYTALAKLARQYLLPNGVLVVEIHEDFAHEVQGTFLDNGLSEVKIHKDLQGKDRMVSAVNE